MRILRATVSGGAPPALTSATRTEWFASDIRVRLQCYVTLLRALNLTDSIAAIFLLQLFDWSQTVLSEFFLDYGLLTIDLRSQFTTLQFNTKKTYLLCAGGNLQVRVFRDGFASATTASTCPAPSASRGTTREETAIHATLRSLPSPGCSEWHR